jgi:hypothetical protein
MASDRAADAECFLALSLGVLGIVLAPASITAGLFCIAAGLAVFAVVWAPVFVAAGIVCAGAGLAVFSVMWAWFG